MKHPFFSLYVIVLLLFIYSFRMLLDRFWTPFFSINQRFFKPQRPIDRLQGLYEFPEIICKACIWFAKECEINGKNHWFVVDGSCLMECVFVCLLLVLTYYNIRFMSYISDTRTLVMKNFFGCYIENTSFY